MRTRNEREVLPLSEYWRPPSHDALEDGAGAPVACLASTFEFEADFFEEELLPRFLGLRFDRTESERTFVLEREEALASARAAVLVDISKFDPRQTTLQWDQLPIQVPGGIQHAKVTLLIWERVARLIVASANLTRQGYRRNRELFAALDFFDAADSAPLAVAHEALDFFDTVCTWSRALPAATQRTRETVQQVRQRLRQWSRAPKDFGPRARPRVAFIAGYPRSPGRPGQSVLDRLLALWGERRVIWLNIVTPFVWTQDGDEDPVLARLRRLPKARKMEGWLVVPEAGTPDGKKRPVIALPRAFGRAWKKWLGERAYVLPVPQWTEDEGNRPLHAKAVLIQGELHDLLMIGSSNFTPHGMGVGGFNCEANLAFEDWWNAKREGLTLEDRLGLPVPWDEAVGVDEVVWQQPEGTPDDAPPAAPQLPRFFAWASYSQSRGEIVVGLDRTQPEPQAWTISFPSPSGEQPVVLFSRSTSSPKHSELRLTLSDHARGAHLAALRVAWQEQDGSEHEGFLAVSVEDRDKDLLPPHEFRRLTVDSIIECLLSGKDPAEWLVRQAGRKTAVRSIESLDAVDTSAYPLYRVKRFGQALAAMAERIEGTALTPDAIRYRLLRDPLGAVRLAEALASEEAEKPAEATRHEDAHKLYLVAEIVLCLAHVGRRLRRKAGRGKKWLVPLLAQAGVNLRAVAKALRERSAPVPKDLERYVKAALSEYARLAAIPHEV